jgi:sugar phosphate isomerase/epimerase
MAYRDRMRHDQIAVQLFAVREALAADPAAALRDVATAGYRFVELAAVAHVPTPDLARILDGAGLRAVASHEPIARLREDPTGVAHRLRALGCDRAIVPDTPAQDRATLADVRRFAAELRALGGTLAEHGIRLGYHNHGYEFAPLEGATMWDVLLADLPPEVELELDVYWASIGGRDPVEVIGEAAERVRLLHVKDRAPGPEPRDAVPGEGTLAIPAIVEAGRAIGAEWYITELVDSADPLAAIAAAARYLERLAS